MSDNSGAVLAVAAVVALVLANGSKQDTEPPLVKKGGPAKVAGTLSGVSARQGAAMGNNLQPKAVDSLVTVLTTWFPRTTDVNGNFIAWPYRIKSELGHNTWQGWKHPNELSIGSSDDGVRTSDLGSVAGNTQQQTVQYFNVPPDPTNTAWDVRVHLYAPPSKSDGTPDTLKPWLELGHAENVGAFTSVSKATPATPAGDALNVDVSNMRQERPNPWGGNPRGKVNWSMDEFHLRQTIAGNVTRGTNLRGWPSGSMPGTLARGYGLSAGMNQGSWMSPEYVPAFRTAFNPGMGQVPRDNGRGVGSHGAMPFRDIMDEIPHSAFSNRGRSLCEVLAGR